MNHRIRRPRVLSKKLPHPLLFKTEVFSAGTRFVSHTHPWGELNHAVQGVMELTIQGKGFLSPPHYAVWTPPDVEHDGYNSYETRYSSIYIDRGLCAALPKEPCTLALDPLLKAILDHFITHQIEYPKTAEELRLAQVFVDQLRQAPRHLSYLPLSPHPKLSVLLRAMQEDPGSQRKFSAWSKSLHITERTLARHFRTELGMSFGEWRQRLLLTTALSRLNRGDSVQNIALDLGYSTSSAFIAMFRRMTGSTPLAFYRQKP